MQLTNSGKGFETIFGFKYCKALVGENTLDELTDLRFSVGDYDCI